MDHILKRIKKKEQFWIKPKNVTDLLPLLNKLKYVSHNTFIPVSNCSHYNINFEGNGRRICSYPNVISYNGDKQGTELTPSMLWHCPIISRRS